MTILSVIYPYTEGESFDVEYYSKNHMGLVKKLMGDACIRTYCVTNVRAPGSDQIKYVCIGNLVCESQEAFYATFPKIKAQLDADMPNFTKIQPIATLCELIE
jgi:uncharacterized protein (TIGR02118 family)